jgi:hypothetical protein
MSTQSVAFPILNKFVEIGNRSLLIMGDAGTGKKTLYHNGYLGFIG